MSETRKHAITSENFIILKQLWTNALKHIALLWKEWLRKWRHKNLILHDIQYIERHLWNIQNFLRFHHYELLFSQNLEGTIINIFFLENFLVNKIFIAAYNIVPDLQDKLAYYNNIFSSPIISDANYTYEMSFGMYVFQDTLSQEYYWMQDNAGMLSVNIFRTKWWVSKGNITLDISNGQRVNEQEEVELVYTWSIFMWKDSIFITCLQSIKWYRQLNFEYKFYRYILYAIEKIGKNYNKNHFYSFTDRSHPCSWEEDSFRWDYNNIFQKRWWKLDWKYIIGLIDWIGNHKKTDFKILKNIDTSLVELFKKI